MVFTAYHWPKMKAKRRLDALRDIATLHSFRFLGLALILPGFVGPNLPSDFAKFAAYGDLAASALAILALLTFKVRPLFLTFVVAFNIVGFADLAFGYYHALLLGVPSMAGQEGGAYMITIVYMPLLIITHFVAFYLLIRPEAEMLMHQPQS